MKLLTQILSGVPEFPRLLAALDSGGWPAAVSGLSAVHRAHFAAGIWQQTGRPVVLLCADETEADRLAEDLTAFTGQAVRRLSARDFTFHNAAVVSRQWEHRRLALLDPMARGELPYVVATVEGQPMRCTIRGVLGGILPEGTPVFRGMKAGDVDPRGKREYCDTVSDKALAVGGGVLEAVLALSGKLKEEP